MSNPAKAEELDIAVSRDPSIYRRSGHLLDRLEDPVRPIRDDMVKQTITDGFVAENRAKKDKKSWRFVREVDGVNIIVPVCESKYCQELRLVTAFCEVFDYDLATSEWTRWSTHDVDVMVLLASFSGDPRDGKQLDEIDVDYPVRYNDHRLVCYDDEESAYCVTCRKVGSSKDYFEASPCNQR